MTLALPQLSDLWSAYPTGTADFVKAKIGGNVNLGWVTNTCVIRVSRAMNYSGHKIPKTFVGLSTIRGGDALRYAYRVKEFKVYMDSTFGPPDVTSHSKTPIPNEKGVIMFDVEGWSDATGHFDLYDGENCAGSGYWSKAHTVYIWRTPGEVSDAPATPLSGSSSDSEGADSDDAAPSPDTPPTPDPFAIDDEPTTEDIFGDDLASDID